MSALPLLEVDALEITILVDNQIDTMLTGDDQVRRRSMFVDARNPFLEGERSGLTSLHAEHGFSALVTVVCNDERHTLLFDTGVSANGMMENLDRLQLDPKDVEAVALSHGHFDHTGGLAGFAERLGRLSMPIFAHRLAFTRRRVAPPQGEPRLQPTPSRSAIEGAGFELLESDDPSLLFQKTVLLTGEVPRVTDFEQGYPFFQRESDHGWEPEPHLMDDQALIANVKGKGLVVLTGCGHAGIVNIVTRAEEATGISSVYAVMGGFHLPGPFFDPIVPLVVERLRQFEPKVIVPAHCTGWKAQHAIATALPAAYVHNAVGTTYLF